MGTALDQIARAEFSGEEHERPSYISGVQLMYSIAAKPLSLKPVVGAALHIRYGLIRNLLELAGLTAFSLFGREIDTCLLCEDE